MTKQLFVSSNIQAALLKSVLIPQMKDGFWKDHRPANHYKEWMDVEVVVSESQQLGPVNFVVPRTYNFVNPEFIKPNEHLLVSTAQKVKPNSTFRSVKKELIELSRIVGGRLADKNGIPSKAFRGVNAKSGKAMNVDVSVLDKARAALHGAVASVKRTAVKKPTEPSNVEIIRTAAGATVRRVPVQRTPA